MTAASASKMLTFSRPEHVSSATGQQDDDAHDYQHQLVVPSVISPEFNVPHENFLLNRAEHDQNEADSGWLDQDSKGNAEAAQYFGDAQEDCETLAHADALASSDRIFQMVQATGKEDETHHQS